jgi:hypothetical protein
MATGKRCLTVVFPNVHSAAEFVVMSHLNLVPLKPITAFTDPVHLSINVQDFEVGLNREYTELSVPTHYEVTEALGAVLCGTDSTLCTTEKADVTCPRCYDMLRGLAD